MRSVVYDMSSKSGYACAECGEQIEPVNMFDDAWQCGHAAEVEADVFAAVIMALSVCSEMKGTVTI